MVVLLGGPGHAEEPVVCRLRFEPQGQVCYAESFTGQGELIRHVAADRDETIKLEVEAAGRREWRVEELTEEDALLTATSLAGSLRLGLPGRTWQDQQAWRGFRLRVTPAGAVLEAEALPSPERQTPDDPDALPFDLDLSEFLSMLELGLLPPQALTVGQTWQVPAGAGAAPLRAEGRLVEVTGEPGERVAVLETKLTATIPERAAPAAGYVLGGALTGGAKVRFGLDAGAVLGATGPLDLRLEFRRRGANAVLATVTLHLNVVVTREAGPPPAA